MSVSLGLLSFVATVPQEFEGNASGLLGNFNGDDSDDLRYPNGTEIDVNSPHRLIHDFGQSCKGNNSGHSQAIERWPTR